MSTRPSKSLTNGQWAALIRDFKASFKDASTVTNEELFDWTVQTREVYDWLWPRYVHSYVTKHADTGRLASAVFSGLFNGLRNQSAEIAGKLDYRVLYATAETVHAHYLKLLRETHPGVFIPDTVEQLDRHRRDLDRARVNP